MSKYEQPMIERYWRSVGGALFLEFPMVKRSADSGPRWLDGLIVPDLAQGMWRWAEAVEQGFTPEEVIKDRHIIAVQAKNSRLGMNVMGQAVFTVGLFERFRPASVKSVALVRGDDATLSPLLKPFPAVQVVVDDRPDSA
jgi:hypothetical protein